MKGTIEQHKKVINIAFNTAIVILPTAQDAEDRNDLKINIDDMGAFEDDYEYFTCVKKIRDDIYHTIRAKAERGCLSEGWHDYYSIVYTPILTGKINGQSVYDWKHFTVRIPYYFAETREAGKPDVASFPSPAFASVIKDEKLKEFNHLFGIDVLTDYSGELD